MTLVNPDPFFVVAAAKIGTIKINEVCRIIDTRLYYAPHTIILFLIAILIETVKLLPHIHMSPIYIWQQGFLAG